MRALLIEDEPLARKRMIQLLAEVAPSIIPEWEADSLESALRMLKTVQPDLIFTDIQLGDGTCFHLFDQHRPQCPVVFITAFDEFALRAFQLNTVDYLLKPLRKEDLERATKKVLAQIGSSVVDYDQLVRLMLEEEQKNETRFLIRFGEHIRSISSGEIAYIYTVQKAVFFVLHSGKEYPADQSLDTLEKELDPRKFFRINRQFIVGMKAIGPMSAASKSRVRIELIPPFLGEEVVVSTERSPIFKSWLGKK